jgi:hypothetical protein
MAKEVSSVNRGDGAETAQLAALASLATAPGGDQNAVLQAAILSFINEQSRRQAAADAVLEAKKRQDEIIKAGMRSDVKAAVASRDKDLDDNQNACTHRWDPPHQNQTNVVGAYMISGSLYLTCQSCGKVFEGKEGFDYVNRNGLMPKYEHIAGKPVPA